jgi:hypothetical protein
MRLLPTAFLILCGFTLSYSAAEDKRKVFNAGEVVSKFLQEGDFATCSRSLDEWRTYPASHKLQILSTLANQLRESTEVKLVNLNDTMVLPRLVSGELKGHGHGAVIWQDIFIHGGKAAWAVESLLDTQLPPITTKSTKEELDVVVSTANDLVKAYKRGYEDALTSK